MLTNGQKNYWGKRHELVGKNAFDEFPEARDLTFHTYYETSMKTGQAACFEEYYPPIGMWLEVRCFKLFAP